MSKTPLSIEFLNTPQTQIIIFSLQTQQRVVEWKRQIRKKVTQYDAFCVNLCVLKIVVKIYFCLCILVCVYVCSCVHGCLWNTDEGIRCSGWTWRSKWWGTVWRGCWEPNSKLLQEQQMLWTAEPSLQPLKNSTTTTKAFLSHIYLFCACIAWGGTHSHGAQWGQRTTFGSCFSLSSTFSPGIELMLLGLVAFVHRGISPALLKSFWQIIGHDSI